MIARNRTAAIAAAIVVAALSSAFADEPDRRPAAAIQDNSYLVEEAYNQEEGVVQHIFNLRRKDRDWSFSFTQEWPVVDQTHQFSYTVPYSWLRADSGREHGFGDLLLNWRVQALEESDAVPAFAPRLSLILPSGDDERGLGDGTVGYQANLPVSKIVADRWTLHANAGLTAFPNLNGRNPVSYSLGASAIYAVSRTFNFMLETLGEWEESVEAGGGIDRGFTTTISPGFRYALNLDAGQLVWGLAAPIGLTRGNTDYGVFVYVSFEHDFLK